MSRRSYRRVMTGLGIVVCLAACLVVGADKDSCGVTMGGAASGYTCEVIYARGCPGLCGITRSPDGTIYGRCEGKNHAGIVRLEIKEIEGKKKAIPHRLVLPTELKTALDAEYTAAKPGAKPEKRVSKIVAGPDNTLYIKVHQTLWRIDTKANPCTANKFTNFNGSIVAYDPVAKTLVGYRGNDQNVLFEWKPSELGKEPLSDLMGNKLGNKSGTAPPTQTLTSIFDIAIHSETDKNGVLTSRVLLVSCRPEAKPNQPGKPIEVWLVRGTKANGSWTWEKPKRVAEKGLKYGEGNEIKDDPVHVAYHDKRKTFFVRTMKHFLEVTTNGTVMSTLTNAVGTPYSRSPCQFVFVRKDNKDKTGKEDANEVYLVDATDGQIVYSNLSTASVALSSEGNNTPAMVVDPIGNLFTGSKGNLIIGIAGEPIRLRVLQPSGKVVATYKLTGLKGEVRDLGFGPKGELYIASLDPDGRKSRVSFVRSLPQPKGDLQSVAANQVVKVAERAGNHFLSVAISGGALLATATTITKKNGKETATGLEVLAYPLETRNASPSATYKTTAGFWTALKADAKDITEFRIVRKGAKTYAYLGASKTTDHTTATRWIVELGLAGGNMTVRSTVATDRHPTSNQATGNLSIDTQGILWWLLAPAPFELKKVTVTPKPDPKSFASELPIDPAAVESYYDSAGHHVYMTSPQGIHHFFKPSPSGGKKEGACVCPGDKLTPGISKTSKHAC